MRVGLVLPAPAPTGPALPAWAARAEAAGFAAVAVLERPGPAAVDPLPVLAALAAGTRRIGLVAALGERREGALFQRDVRTLRELAGARLALTWLRGDLLEALDGEPEPVRRSLVRAGAELATALQELEADGVEEAYLEPAGADAAALDELRRILR